MSIQKPTRKLRILLIVLSVLLVLLLAALAFVGNFFYEFSLNPHSSVAFSPTLEVITPETAPGTTDENNLWLVKTAQVTTLTSQDNLQLSAYELTQNQGHNWAIVCHGYQSNASYVGNLSRLFYDLGYRVLAPDARGHGLSEGEYIGMGWDERRDVIDWCNSIIARDPQAQIVLFGLSMGAATVMMASGEADLPANVKAVVEDCGYTSVWDEFAGQLKELYGLPPFPILDATNLVTQFRAGYDLKKASALEQVKKSVTPTLFIHGEADTFVPYEMMDVVYTAATCEKERLSIPGAVHAKDFETNPALYQSTVEAFLSKYVPAEN